MREVAQGKNVYKMRGFSITVSHLDGAISADPTRPRFAFELGMICLQVGTFFVTWIIAPDTLENLPLP